MTALNQELSDREIEILTLVATGASNKEIAQKLSISSNTVKVHLRNIFGKIEVTSRTEAAMYAVNAGLVASAAPVLPPSTQVVEMSPSELSDEAALVPIEIVPPVLPERKAAHQVDRWWLAGLFVFLLVVVVVVGALIPRQPAGQASIDTPLPTISPRWQRMASMPTARFGLALAAYEDDVYALAGDSGEGPTGLVERYNPANNIWTKMSGKPTPVKDIGAAAIGGKIYVPGGISKTGEPVKVLEIYDPRLDEWSTGAPLPVAISAYALAAYEGNLYLFGGWDGQRYLANVWEYDPDQDRWSERTPMPTRRAYAGAASAAGRIYVMGGYDGEDSLAINEVYQPDRESNSENPWTQARPLPSPRHAFGMTSLADIIYVLGGEGETEDAKVLLEYYPQQNQWQQLESLVLNSWTHLGVAPLQTRLYIQGGNLDGIPTTQNLAYQAIYTVLFPVVK